ncbi:MAG: radical SAM protein [Kangiellaceae bacterium]
MISSNKRATSEKLDNVPSEIPCLHLFDGGDEKFAYDVEGRRVLQLPVWQYNAIETALRQGDKARGELIAKGFGITSPMPPKTTPPASVSLRALSLAISQKCNMGCTYCYAQKGTFGAEASNMSSEVAKASVDRLIKDAPQGERVTLAFMGGEPLTNRKTLHETVHYAAMEASSRNIGIGFSMTTNGTLLRDEDVALFNQYEFTITVSIDGLQKQHDLLRPLASGRGSFERIEKNLKRLFALEQRRFRVLGRVTVTPQNLDLTEIIECLLIMGFDEITFTPMLTAPSGADEMQTSDLGKLLEQLVASGELFKKSLRLGRILDISNITSMLKRIHLANPEHYPCGAGGGYMGTSSSGELYACHRFVNDDDGHLGNVKDGINVAKQSDWLRNRHLRSQPSCTTCWARYLCSGSCHHEVLNRGRPACDYIRGWTQYCLQLYAELSLKHPQQLFKIVRSY